MLQSVEFHSIKMVIIFYIAFVSIPKKIKMGEIKEKKSKKKQPRK